MHSRVDLIADLIEQDDAGRGWSTISDARDPRRLQPGAVLAGNEQARSLVRVVEPDADGQVHFEILYPLS